VQISSLTAPLCIVIGIFLSLPSFVAMHLCRRFALAALVRGGSSSVSLAVPPLQTSATGARGGAQWRRHAAGATAAATERHTIFDEIQQIEERQSSVTSPTDHALAVASDLLAVRLHVCLCVCVRMCV